VLLLQEAGGTVTDWDDRPWRPATRRVVASNGRIHDELLRELAVVRRPIADSR
jgi:myo-inositol-1(or 4)-monophosphatase